MKRVLLVSGIFIVLLTTCIDPYVLNLDDYESLLVVDGLITDEAEPYTITLSQTFSNQNESPRTMTGASVYIVDQDLNRHFFTEVTPGVYQSDPQSFVTEPGQTYTLRIATTNGHTYVSDPCLLSSAPDIDSIYYVKDTEYFDNGTTQEDGMRILVNSGPVNGEEAYFRWTYDEDWKFKVPYPEAYAFQGENTVISIPVVNEFCWKSNSSTQLNVQSVTTGETDRITAQPITFIAPTRTDRLQVQYSILVKQYAISKEEYNYWLSLKQVTEEGGDIFDQQPYIVTGNIHGVKYANEKVLGYFSVSGKKEKRIYITKYDALALKLPNYRTSCEVLEVGPDPGGYQQTFRTIYNLYTGMGYVLAYPVYVGLSLDKLAFTEPICSDCSLSGDPKKPDFWVDLP